MSLRKRWGPNNAKWMLLWRAVSDGRCLIFMLKQQQSKQRHSFFQSFLTSASHQAITSASAHSNKLKNHFSLFTYISCHKASPSLLHFTWTNIERTLWLWPLPSSLAPCNVGDLRINFTAVSLTYTNENISCVPKIQNVKWRSETACQTFFVFLTQLFCFYSFY